MSLQAMMEEREVEMLLGELKERKNPWLMPKDVIGVWDYQFHILSGEGDETEWCSFDISCVVIEDEPTKTNYAALPTFETILQGLVRFYFSADEFTDYAEWAKRFHPDHMGSSWELPTIHANARKEAFGLKEFLRSVDPKLLEEITDWWRPQHDQVIEDNRSWIPDLPGSDSTEDDAPPISNSAEDDAALAESSPEYP